MTFRLLFTPLLLVPVFYGYKAASAGTTGAAGLHIAHVFRKNPLHTTLSVLRILLATFYLSFLCMSEFLLRND